MLIYRVEDDTGYGMFRSDNAPLYTGIDLYEHPFPESDIPGIVDVDSDELFFGCLSIEALDHWLSICGGVHEMLHKIGFYISVYEADESDVLIGGKQVAFYRKKATEVERRSLCPQSIEPTSIHSLMDESFTVAVQMENGIRYEEMERPTTGSWTINVYAFPIRWDSVVMGASMKEISYQMAL